MYDEAGRRGKLTRKINIRETRRKQEPINEERRKRKTEEKKTRRTTNLNAVEGLPY